MPSATGLLRLSLVIAAVFAAGIGALVAASVLVPTDSVVKLVVRDEGEGVRDVKTLLPGVGIPGMRERAQQLGGRMELNSTTSGTTVTVTLPLRSAP